MKILPIIVFAAFLASCGPGVPGREVVGKRQPRVVSVEPADGSSASADQLVVVEFSEPLEPSTVDRTTFAIVEGRQGGDGGGEIAADLAEGAAEIVEGKTEFSAEGRVLVFQPLAPYAAGGSYRVVATSGIMSADLMPLVVHRMRPGEAFVSAFTVEGLAEGEAFGGAGADAAAGEAAPQGTVVKRRPVRFIINELLYDVPGDDTNGVLFIELQGDAGAEVGGYRITFVNGEDGEVTEEIKIPEGARIPDDGILLIADAKTGQPGASGVAGADLIDNFDPQNGPDGVQLLDDQGRLLDALGYGSPIALPATGELACFEGTPASKAPPGQSLSRTGGQDTDDNLADFRALSAPTPGQP